MNKRYKIIMIKLKKIKSKLMSLVKGWKVRKIMKSDKLQSIQKYIKKLNK